MLQVSIYFRSPKYYGNFHVLIVWSAMESEEFDNGFIVDLHEVKLTRIPKHRFFDRKYIHTLITFGSLFSPHLSPWMNLCSCSASVIDL